MFTLKTTKYVSLSSIIGSVSVAIIAPFIGLIPPHWHYSTVGIITNFVIAALIVFKHHANISRIKNGTESKVQWL
jgi:glycerol-3-phosphate acyltransferase PlsY